MLLNSNILETHRLHNIHTKCLIHEVVQNL